MSDIALVGNMSTGKIVVHRADCPDARKAAADGHPVLTLFDCQNDAPLDLPKHSCMDDPNG